MLTRPMPPLRGEEAVYYRQLAEGRFVLQHCGACDRFIYYPRVVCPHCGRSDQLEYRESAGTGTVYTFTVCHRPGHPASDMPGIGGVMAAGATAILGNTR